MANSSNLKTIFLAAGLGQRLKPLTNVLPKCLMPINGIPLLEYWLAEMYKLEIRDILVNVHYRSSDVINFLSRPRFSNWVKYIKEDHLLGTAGTVRANIDFLEDSSCLLVHADNWCCCDLKQFIDFHINSRPKNTLITMMTFESDDPRSCGIVETDNKGVVIAFHEKVENPPSNKANAAIYLIEPEVIRWIDKRKLIFDFSTDVIPSFIGKIATWHNESVHRDIGTIDSLLKAQDDSKPSIPWKEKDGWQESFELHDIHKMIDQIRFN